VPDFRTLMMLVQLADRPVFAQSCCHDNVAEYFYTGPSSALVPAVKKALDAGIVEKTEHRAHRE